MKDGFKNFKNGKQEGPWTYWYDSGEKQEERSYKNGKIDGQRIEWFKNGQKKSEAIWKNSRPVGIETKWNEDGDVIKTTTHEEGENEEIE